MEAPDYLIRAYQSDIKRSILEALLIDPETPELVYVDLLGWDSKIVEQYRKYFFVIPKDMSRLSLFEFIDTAPTRSDSDIRRKNLMLAVYEYGWSYIDSSYNKGRRISIQDQTINNLKKIVGRLDVLVARVLKDPNISDIREVLKLMKEAINVDAISRLSRDTVEELTFRFVEEMQLEAKKGGIDRTKIMGMEFDEIKRLIPAENKEELKEELAQIAKDIKEIEDKAAEDEKKV